MNIKRVLAICLSAVMLICSIPVFALDTETTDAGDVQDVMEARVVFGSKLEKSGFGTIKSKAENVGIVDRKGGEECWTISASNLNIYLDLEDEFANEVSDGSIFDIEVEYYSESGAFFELRYDSVDTRIVHGDVIGCGNDQVWKKKIFTVDDAFFGNRLEGNSDIKLCARTGGRWFFANDYYTSSAPAYIKSVTVRRYVAERPVTISSVTNEAGNTYEWYRDEKNVTNTFTNTYGEDVEINVSYKLIDMYGVTRFSKEESFEIKAGESLEKQLNLETDYCSIYDYEVDIEIPSKGVSYHTKPLGIAIAKTDENGVKNDMHYWNAHLSAMDYDMASLGIEMIAKSNSWGLRDSQNWNEHEPANGAYTGYHDEEKIWELARENGLHYQWILGVRNVVHGVKSPHFEGWTEGQISAYRKYLEWLTSKIGDLIDCYELTNEPTLNGYGKEGGSEAYFNLAKVAYPIVKELDPDAPFIVLSQAYMNRDYEKYDFYSAMMDMGLADYCDGLALHPYMHFQPYETEYCYDHIFFYSDHFEEKTGIKDIPMWSTEVGNTTADEFVGTDYKQGNMAVRSNVLYRAWNLGGAYTSYQLEDKGTIESDREQNFGLAGPGNWKIPVEDNSARYFPKDGYLGITAMNYLMANVENISLDTYNDNTYVDLVKSEKFDNKRIATVWNKGEDCSMTFDLGVNEVTMFDFYGNEKVLKSDNGTYSFQISERPFYIMGDFSSIKPVDANVIYDDGLISAARGDILVLDVEYPNADSNASAEVEVPAFAEEIENTGFVNGKAVVKLQLSNDFVGDSILRVNVKNGDTYVQSKDYRLYVGDIVKSSVSNKQTNANNYNRWQLLFDVENLSNSNLAEGKIRINSPKMLAEIANIDLGRILCGKVSEIVVNTPQITRKSMYEIDYDVILKDGTTYNFKQALDFTITPKVKNKVVVDGKVGDGEWDWDTAMVSDTLDSVKKIEDWSGKEDLSARTMIMWDKDKLYLFAEVLDDVFNNSNQADSLWAGDSVQFGLFYNQNAHIAVGQGNSDFNEIGIALLRDGPAVYKFKDQNNRADAIGVVEDCEVAVIREGKKTCYEFAITWESLMGEKIDVNVGDEIGYSILYNDDDGAGRRGWIEYASGIGTYKNTDLFTYLKFVE